MKIYLILLINISLFAGQVAQKNISRDSAKEVVIDSSTALMWEDDIKVKTLKKDWYDARLYCKNLSFAGFNDWHLPTIIQLRSIVDKSRYNPALKEGFINIVPSTYWSSSQAKNHAKSAISIYFKSGISYEYNMDDIRYVRCVRKHKKL